MSYIYDYTLQMRSDLNGLTLIQLNPAISVDLRDNSENFSWLFEKKDDSWQKLRKVDKNELENIHDQVADGAVLDAEVAHPKKTNKLR